MLQKILNYLERSRSDKLDKLLSKKLKREESKSEESKSPIVVIEESFTVERSNGDAIFKIRFEVPSLLNVVGQDEKEEDLKQKTDMIFRPLVVTLEHYLWGLSLESSPKRFIMGRDNLISAIKQCAIIQLRSLQEEEKNR